MWAAQHTRKPMLLLRLAARQFLGLLFQDPPRSTRDTFQAAPQADACLLSMVARDSGRKKIARRCAALSVFRKSV